MRASSAHLGGIIAQVVQRVGMHVTPFIKSLMNWIWDKSALKPLILNMTMQTSIALILVHMWWYQSILTGIRITESVYGEKCDLDQLLQFLYVKSFLNF